MATAQSADAIEPLDDIAVRALTETMSVIDWIDRARGAPGLYEVITQSGSQYLVDLATGSCECPDARYRDRRCKHLARVEFEVGEQEIPAWVDPDDVDRQLGRHVREGEPRWASR